MIKLKVKELYPAFKLLADLIQTNNQPFVGQAKRLQYKLQPELNYYLKCTVEDRDAINDQELTFGEHIAQPEYYPQESRPILIKLCGEVPEPEIQIKKLLE